MKDSNMKVKKIFISSYLIIIYFFSLGIYYNFIYEQMPDVVSCADVILSRAGANSIWEAAVLLKPMVLVPLCGNGTRGDQVDNAEFFRRNGAAEVLLGAEANRQHLKESLTLMLDSQKRTAYSQALKKLTGTEVPAKKIAAFLFGKINNDKNDNLNKSDDSMRGE